MTRIHLAFRHPMDTGFVANIPTYNLSEVDLIGADGADLGSVALEASVSEDPALTLITSSGRETIAIKGRDTNGFEYHARLTPR